jgi:hypothetical protein
MDASISAGATSPHADGDVVVEVFENEEYILGTGWVPRYPAYTDANRVPSV